jgi:hypothetical protein
MPFNYNKQTHLIIIKGGILHPRKPFKDLY